MQGNSDSQRRIRESWDENAAAWTRAVRENRIASRLAGTNRAVVDAVSAVHTRRTGAGAPRVLDVGCGEGWLSHVLSRDGYDVTGFDGSADLILLAGTGPGRFLQLDYGTFVEDPAVVGDDFDAVVCNFALFDEDVVPFLCALATLLASDGVLIIQTVHPMVAATDRPYKDGWHTESFETMGADFREMPWYFRTLGSWIDVLRRAALVVIRCDEPVAETGRPLSLIFSCRPTSVSV